MNAAKPTLPSFAKLPKTYAALCRLHLPRTLHDEIELDAVTEIIDLMAAHLDNIGMTATEWGRLIGIDRSTARPLPCFSVASGSLTPHTSEKPPKLSASKHRC
jgi:hypothetical protein